MKKASVNFTAGKGMYGIYYRFSPLCFPKSFIECVSFETSLIMHGYLSCTIDMLNFAVQTTGKLMLSLNTAGNSLEVLKNVPST